VTAVRRTTRPDEPAPLAGPAPSPGAPIAAADFARLFAVEAPRVWRALRRLGVRDADLEDVCQEVFVVVHERWAEFRGDSSTHTWIYGIALRKALAYRRSAHARRATSLEPGDEPVIAPDQQRHLERAHARQVLQAALDQLDDGQREVFVLFELEQLAMREVAAALGLPLQTCYSRLYAARLELGAGLQRLAARGGWP
jgi:RNA polymerase sigma-70 factor, ECF subfamily